jgi:hypothetical protein
LSGAGSSTTLPFVIVATYASRPDAMSAAAACLAPIFVIAT